MDDLDVMVGDMLPLQSKNLTGAHPREQAYVFITGRRQSALNNAVKAIGENVTGVQADGSNLGDLDKLYTAIRQQKGRLDILFANAGGGTMAPLGSITEEHYDSIFDTNVKGLVFTVQKALPLMPDGASIILNASTTSITGTAAFSIYSATKAAVRSFARCWTLDLKDRGIRVNAVSPGPIGTPGLAGLGRAGYRPTTTIVWLLSFAGSHGPSRKTGGGRQGSRFSCILRQFVHHRNRVVC